jgi:hypothetical protein
MSTFKLLGAVAVLSSLSATPVLAHQTDKFAPGVFAELRLRRWLRHAFGRSFFGRAVFRSSRGGKSRLPAPWG